MSFTKKQRVFIDEYVTCWNASEAARRAGYSKKTAYSSGQRLLKDVEIKAEIDARLEASRMSSDEVLKEFTDLAHGDIGDFMDDYMNIDMRKAKALGITKLIKKIRQKTVTHQAKNESDEDRESHDVEIELYPRDKALEILGKYHGLFKEQVDVTSGGEKLNIIVKVGIDPDKL